jgi:RNA polymerase sigma-70 factor, ECF subfamily
MVMSQFRTSNHRQLFDIIGLRQGEKRAFETIYLDFFDMLFHMANGYVRNREVSKELVQDAF